MFQTFKTIYGLLQEVKTARPHFDVDFYRARNPELSHLSETRLLMHYALVGWKQGLDPSADFSTARYLQTYGDVAAAGVNPFAHYLTKGKAEGREPRPDTPLDAELALLTPHLDAAYYRSVTPGLDALEHHELVAHFHATGWREGRDPSPSFSVSRYLAAYPKVASEGINPLLHYLTRGEDEGCTAIRPDPFKWAHLTASEQARLEAAFDPDYYRAITGETADDTRTLLEHYFDIGWRIGYDPNPEFSGQFYRHAYGLTDDLCPLLDYVTGDHAVARSGNPDAAQTFALEAHATTVPHRMMEVLKRPPQPRDAKAPRLVDAKDGLELHWVIPDFQVASGGHATIFRTIRHLENFGHRSVIWIEQPMFHHDVTSAYDDIVKGGQCIDTDVRFVDDGFYAAQGDAVIATGWSSAYYVQAAAGFAGKFYFVQDHEPEFYPSGTERLLAERTYHFDLACICAGPWLSQVMRETYGRWSRDFALAYDPEVYADASAVPDGVRKYTKPGPLHIALYAREHTPRRAVHLALMGLELLAQSRDDFEVHLFGQKQVDFRAAPFKVHNHGVLSAAELAQLYAECDLGICFSATNYSLIPQEMMACGLPVAELNGPSTRAIFPEGTAALVGPQVEDISAALDVLLSDADARAAQAAAAAEWVQGFDWETSARAVEAALFERLHETGKIKRIPTIEPSKDVALDVVIPTFNGLEDIQKVITALRDQRLRANMRIHCIDSSSTDGTTEWLRDQADVGLTVIPQEDFQHGRTRNDGAALGGAPLIAYLTQDALPVGRSWATDLVKMMQHYPQAAGVFGRHLAYPDHCLRVKQDIAGHFQNLLHHPLELSRDTDRARWDSGDLGWRRLLHFYSDNNSAMRRTVWRDHPYPEVNFGEDQLWARGIIEAGLSRVYAPTAAVYHSHDFDPEEAFERSYTEGHFFAEYFDYELGEGSAEELEYRIAFAQRGLVSWAWKYGVSDAELARQQDILAHKYRGWRAGRIAAEEGRD